jgi:hypothetical protein
MSTMGGAFVNASCKPGAGSGVTGLGTAQQATVIQRLILGPTLSFDLAFCRLAQRSVLDAP